jgi:hypothetical protein
MSNYWQIKNGKLIKRIYKGTATKKDVMKTSEAVRFAKVFGLSKPVLKRIEKAEWDKYKYYKAELGKVR